MKAEKEGNTLRVSRYVQKTLKGKEKIRMELTQEQIQQLETPCLVIDVDLAGEKI